MSITAGTYEILPLGNVATALDVTGNSAANGANVRLWGRNGSNGQKWDLATKDGYWVVRDAETGKALDVAGGKQVKGANVQMWNYNDSAAQRWKVTQVGTQAVNGTAYPVVTLGAFNGTTYMLDVTQGKAAASTNIEIWTANGTAGQRFVLVPTEWLAEGGSQTGYTGLPTPSSGTWGTAQGEVLPSVAASAGGTMLPAWSCNEALYQVAYRTRTRDDGADWLGPWSDWQSIADGSTAFGGFGAPGASNCSPVPVGGRRWSPTGVAYDNGGTHNRTDVQVAVRAWRKAWGATRVSAHGPTYTYTVTTVRPVAITDLTVALAADGIMVAWESDAPQDGNAVTLECDAWGTHAITGPASGAALVPQREVERMPAEGDEVTVRMTMRIPDGLEVEATATATVSYDGSHGTDLTLTTTEHPTEPTLRVVTASAADASAWLVITEGHGTRFVPLDGKSPWTVAPPLNRPWMVYASSVGGSAWASKMQTFPAVEDRGWHVTAQDMTRDFAVYVDKDAPPRVEPTFTRTVDEVEVMGRERPVYVPHDSTDVGWTLEGVVYGDGLEGALALHDWALHAGHVYYRSPDGEWYQSLVTGGGVSRIARDAARVSLTMQAEVW